MNEPRDRLDRTRPLLNALTVDVEEHFQVSAFDGVVSRDCWQQQRSRVWDNTLRLLELLEQRSIVGTFFVLGWVAEQNPRLVKEIARRGHEIASHGMSHRLVYRQTPDEFRDETARSRGLLQDLSGQPVLGYRAASFSIGARNLWALDVLAECGFRYDSSLFPVVHDRYGFPGAPRTIHRATTPSGAGIVEAPPSTVAFGKINFPVAGGGYLRLFPLVVTRTAIRRLNDVERMPAVVYLHPWEIDPDQPRIDGPWLSRFRHYTGLRGMESKLSRLTRTFRFGTLAEVIRRAGFAEALEAVDPVLPGETVRR